MSMIDVSNLTFGYEGSPELIFDHVGFQIDSGWKLGFTGRNGRGKTTFLRLLQGEYPYSGTISASVEFEYFPYEVANLSRTGLEVVREIAPEAEDWEIQRELGLLDLAERSLELPFSSLSNGERTKVLLAAMFLKENAFLLIDEPTNHLDIDSREWIEEAVEAYDGTLLFVSHDRYFINRFATRIWELTDGTITDYPCGFAQYRQMKAQEEAEKAAAPKPEKEREKPAAERPQRGNKAQQAARRQLTICERDIAKAEERIAALEADMEAAACDYEKLNELVGQKDAAQAELDALYERWEQLSEEAEG